MCERVARLVDRGRDAFDEDPALWWALERCIEVAGEAASNVDQSTRDKCPGIDWRGLVGVRVLLAHAYHRVIEEPLWEIATVDMPAVARALRSAQPGDQ